MESCLNVCQHYWVVVMRGKGGREEGRGGGVEHELDSDLSQQLGAATWSASRGK